MINEWYHIYIYSNFNGYLVKTELCSYVAMGYRFTLNFKVHKKFVNEFVFINHFESSQIYEHFLLVVGQNIHTIHIATELAVNNSGM